MCSGSSTLLYGLIIKTWTLLVCAEAFSKIKSISPMVLALDLILLRKINSTLIFNVPAQLKNFGDLPLEIIQIIRKEIFQPVNMMQVAQDTMRLVSCGPLNNSCRNCGRYHGYKGPEKFGRSHNHLGGHWTKFLRGACRNCMDANYNVLRKESRSKIEDFLNYYGLSHPDVKPISESQDEFDPYCLETSFSAVSILLSSSTVESEAHHDEGNSSAIPIYFDIESINTTNAAEQFEQLCKQWRLEIYDEPVNEMGNGLVRPKKIESSHEELNVEAVEEVEESKGDTMAIKKQIIKLEKERALARNVDDFDDFDEEDEWGWSNDSDSEVVEEIKKLKNKLAARLDEKRCKKRRVARAELLKKEKRFKVKVEPAWYVWNTCTTCGP